MGFEEYVKQINEKKILGVVDALNKNRFEAKYFKSKEELFDEIKKMIPEGSTTAMGGSTTIKQIDGLSEIIKSYDFKDRKAPANTKEEQRKVQMESTFVDYYFMSSNAITEDGKLYNVDGNGNRVSALIYGPENVVIIATPNKIVKNLDMAVVRNERLAAPINCARLECKTPCVKAGHCMDCRSDDRICIFYTVTGFQRNKGRIKVFFINEELGF